MARQDTMSPAEAPAGGALQRLAHRLGGLGRARLAALTAVVVGIVVISVLSLTGAGGAGPRHAPPARAKNFSLATLGHPGQRISLSSLAGRPVIVNFFASWCVPCAAEAPTLAALRHQGVHIVGVAWKDDPAKTRAFLARYGDPYQAVFVDGDGRTGIDFGVTGVPETYLVGADGRILDKHAEPLTEADAQALLSRAPS